MRVTSLHDAERRPRRVAVGSFDGVHLGHRAVIGDADTVLTFNPHPLEVLAPERAPRLLTSDRRREELIASLGVQELIEIPFDRTFAKQSPQEFIDHVLDQGIGATEVRVGENFRFGAGATGDTALLEAQLGFQTFVVPLLDVDGTVVSSSEIRSLVSQGAVDQAADLLGSRFVIDGTVEKGEARGRQLGFPTANIAPDPRHCLPARGVYAATAILDDGERHPAAVSIGVRPTFDSALGELVEAYLIDFDGDLYGRGLSLEFVRHLRPEAEFDDAEALIQQMSRDVQDARALLAEG